MTDDEKKKREEEEAKRRAEEEKKRAASGLILEHKDFWNTLFAPKDGYRLDRVVATTFTLSLALLPTLLLRALNPGKKLGNAEMSDLPTQIDEKTVEHVKSLLTIFADGRPECLIPPTVQSARLQKYINDFCVPNYVVRVNTDPNADSTSGSKTKKAKPFFHPKLILADFVQEKDGAHFIRGTVLSKNLTFAPDVAEIGCLFESCAEFSADDVELEGAGLCIAELLEVLKNNTPDKHWTGCFLNAKDAVDRLSGTIAALKSQRFRLLPPDDACKPVKAKLLLGMPGKALMTRYTELTDIIRDAAYWCSDSISDQFAKDYRKAGSPRYIISNPHSWAKYGKTYTDVTNAFTPDYCCVASRGLPTYVKVHAKFSETFYKDRTFLLFGSANYTDNAFTNNYECDVSLTYPPRKEPLAQPPAFAFDNDLVKPDPFLYPWEVKKTKSGVQRKYADIRKLDGQCDKKLQEEAENKALTYALTGLTWTLEITQDNNQNFCDMIVCGTADSANRWANTVQKLSDSQQKMLLNAQIDLNGKKLPLTYSVPLTYSGGSANTTVLGVTTAFRKFCIPWSGAATLILFSGKSYETVPIQIQLVPDAKTLNALGLTQEPLDMTNGDIAGLVYGGQIYTMYSLIPKDSPLYRSGDDLDCRLGKYLATGGSLAPIKAAVQERRNAFAKSPDVEDDEDDAPPDQTEGDAYLKRLEDFLTLLNEMEAMLK